MALLDLVAQDARVLREIAKPVDPADIASADIQDLIANMWETMDASEGVGLAAPQVGRGLQIFVLGDRARFIEKMDPRVLEERKRGDTREIVAINPQLDLLGDNWADHPEGCLIVGPIRALVVRSSSVRLTALNSSGLWFAVELHGWPARIAQHEFDHLQGTLFVDRMEPGTDLAAADFETRWSGKPDAEIRPALGLPPARYVDPPRAQFDVNESVRCDDQPIRG